MVGLRFSRLGLGVSALALAAVIAPDSAQAGGFALREQGGYYQGMSFAGNGAGGASPSSMYWNPATITQHPGGAVELNTTLISPHSTIDVDLARNPVGIPIVPLIDSGDVGHPALLPATYSVLQLTDNVFIGSGVNGPFGLVSEADNDWAGRFHGILSKLETYDWNPTVAVRFNDYVSVGVGAQVVYARALLTSATLLAAPFPAGSEGRSELEGHDWGFGFTAGITITPTSRTTIGLGFRSAVDLELDGEIELNNLPFGTPDQPFIDASADLTLPEIVTLSIRHMLTDRITLNGTVEWTNWSRFDELRVRADSARPGIAKGDTVQLVTEDWDDGWFFALGGEFQATDRFAVRAGAAYEITPVPNARRTPRIPDADRIWLSLGGTFQATERLSFDAAYTHIFVEDGDISLASSNESVPVLGIPDAAALRGTAVDQSVDIVSFVARYKFGGGPVFANLGY